VTAVLAEATFGSATVVAWMAEAGAAVRQQRNRLTQLDAAIGDGDHGTNMVRGFDAVEQALAGGRDDLPPGRILILCGKTLIATVGAVDAALASIQDLGAAVAGDKTIVDALEPAAVALRNAIATAEPLSDAVEAAAAAAEAGARATVPLQARKGRASYLGARSIGHQDPGATSAALIMRALERAVSQER
jgi:dihydroxyacetone kinase-like protein